MTTTTHSHKHWTDRGGHVMLDVDVALIPFRSQLLTFEAIPHLHFVTKTLH